MHSQKIEKPKPITEEHGHPTSEAAFRHGEEVVDYLTNDRKGDGRAEVWKVENGGLNKKN